MLRIKVASIILKVGSTLYGYQKLHLKLLFTVNPEYLFSSYFLFFAVRKTSLVSSDLRRALFRHISLDVVSRKYNILALSFVAPRHITFSLCFGSK